MTKLKASAEIIVLMRKMEAEINRLRVALKNYGDHHGECPARLTTTADCKCGFSKFE